MNPLAIWMTVLAQAANGDNEGGGIWTLMLPFAVIWVLIALWLGRDYARRDKLGIGAEQI